MEKQIIEIIEKYKQNQSFQDMVDHMNELPGVKVTRPQMNNWALGIAKPNRFLLFYLFKVGTDWVSNMAKEMLQVMEPQMLFEDELAQSI